MSTQGQPRTARASEAVPGDVRNTVECAPPQDQNSLKRGCVLPGGVGPPHTLSDDQNSLKSVFSCSGPLPADDGSKGGLHIALYMPIKTALPHST